MTFVSRIAAVLVVLVGGLVIAPSPARANYDLCGSLLGSSAADNYIGLCIYDKWGGETIELSTAVAIGGKATKANKCVVTMWAALDRIGSSPWYTPKYPLSCKAALDTRNKWFGYKHLESQTSGTDIDIKACVDLYFDNSSTSGWQGCLESGWHSLGA